jgi:hypothetical protein
MLCLLDTLAFAAGFDILLSEANSPNLLTGAGAMKGAQK